MSDEKSLTCCPPGEGTGKYATITLPTDNVVTSRRHVAETLIREAIHAAETYAARYPGITQEYDIVFVAKQYDRLVGWGMEKDYQLFDKVFQEQISHNDKLAKLKREYVFGVCERNEHNCMIM